ncbi:TIGR03083 family protein [Nakamurella panacisegetis]|uniref:TIGR03083 family protein n=1 Tax=Nakamurella panacisegetis TaxID=1090615 RepID=A0A1H0M031_9ACTN|nr:maleylpyruvate isomerase family mycothiol-dependent enzyme [Nakamurella panacisegetis]SDO73822.1 TIGR03083 family protein [Nakamurella panacisegetis]
MATPNYMDDIRRESARFLQCLSGADPQAPVPTCPDWTAADLLWHLTEVQLFWAIVVRDRLRSPAAAELAKPPRPSGYPELLRAFPDATDQLIRALADADDEDEVWTWADDHTVGFVRRRQAHEVLIHRLDAELVVGAVTPLDADLAEDGVDEALTVIYGGHRAGATFHHAPGFGRVISADTRHHWDLTLGRFTGTSRTTGQPFDEPTISLGPHDQHGTPSFTVTASAADLDAWLWRRPTGAAPVIVGDAAPLLTVIEHGVG